MIKKIWSKVSRDSRYSALGIAFLVLLVEHIFMREYVGDAIAVFSHLIDHSSLLSVLYWRYSSWTSRVLIEAPLIRLSSGMHTTTWAVIDTLMWMLLIWSLMALTHYKHNYLVISLVFIYPIIQMQSAGWMATTINYLWPLAMGSYAMVLLDRIYNQKKVGVVPALLALFALAFATNFEIFGIMYLCLLTYFSLAMCYFRRFTILGFIFTVLQYAISIANIVFALYSPGNKLRLVTETKDNMLDFSGLTVVDKFVIGVNHAFSEMTDNSFLFLCFAFMIFLVAVTSQRRSKVLVATGIVPLAFVLTRTILKPIVIIYSPKFDQLFNDVADQARVGATNYFNFTSYVPFVLYSLIFAAVLIVLLNAFEKLSTGLFLDVVLISGLLTAVAVGFSPTVYASGPRTLLFLNFSFIYIIVRIYTEQYKYISPKKLLNVFLRWGTAVTAVFFVISNLISIGLTQG